MTDYAKIARQARVKVLELIYSAQTSHISSNLSCIDIMTVLFEKIDLNKDKFILSKGWAAASLYYFLWRKGKITEDELNSYCQEGSKFIGLAEPIIPEIPFAGGSMGLSLPAAIGYALSKKLKGEDGNVYVLMSDGEMQCGTTWESFLIAAHHDLNNLVVIVDVNNYQAMGQINDILKIRRVTDGSINHFLGWNSAKVNGHNYKELNRVIFAESLKDMNNHGWAWIQLEEEDMKKSPRIIFANTIKGKGWKRAENSNLFHYSHVIKEMLEEALTELK